MLYVLFTVNSEIIETGMYEKQTDSLNAINSKYTANVLIVNQNCNKKNHRYSFVLSMLENFATGVQ